MWPGAFKFKRDALVLLIYSRTNAYCQCVHIDIKNTIRTSNHLYFFSYGQHWLEPSPKPPLLVAKVLVKDFLLILTNLIKLKTSPKSCFLFSVQNDLHLYGNSFF